MELKFSLLDTIKKIIKKDKILNKYYFQNKYENIKKYKLDEIIKEILYVCKSGLSWRNSRSTINPSSLY
jgi:hypothetical protein